MSDVANRDEIVKAFRARGLTVASWSQRNGFSVSMVYAVLSGRAKGYRGQAYEIARALRLVSPETTGDQFAWLDDEPAVEVKGGKKSGMRESTKA